MNINSRENSDIAEMRAQATRNTEYDQVEYPWSDGRNIRLRENWVKVMKILLMYATLMPLVIMLANKLNKYAMVGAVAVAAGGFPMLLFNHYAIAPCLPNPEWVAGRMYEVDRDSSDPCLQPMLWLSTRFPRLQSLVVWAKESKAKPNDLTHFCTLRFPTRVTNAGSVNFPEEIELAPTREYAEMYFDSKKIYFHFLESTSDTLEAQVL